MEPIVLQYNISQAFLLRYVLLSKIKGSEYFLKKNGIDKNKTQNKKIKKIISNIDQYKSMYDILNLALPTKDQVPLAQALVESR